MRGPKVQNLYPNPPPKQISLPHHQSNIFHDKHDNIMD